MTDGCLKDVTEVSLSAAKTTEYAWLSTIIQAAGVLNFSSFHLHRFICILPRILAMRSRCIHHAIAHDSWQELSRWLWLYDVSPET
jgi:hypothetical protein